MVSLLCAVPVSGGSRAQAASNGGSSKVNLCVKKSTKLELNNVSSKVTWKSSKPSVATVNSKGKVTARKAGKTVVTAKSGKKTYKFVVKVRKHSYTKATCLAAASCKYCGTEKGAPLPHKYKAATCTEPQKCSVCGNTTGEALGHKYTEATCTKAETCTRCGATGTAALGHTYTDPTCTEPGTCTRCGKTGTAALGHTYSEATCTEPGTCIRCGKTGSRALGHTYTKATCTEPGTCIRCGKTGTAALGHTSTRATCTEPGICTRCGATVTEALGHSYTDPTCTEPGSCVRCGATGAPALGHNYTTKVIEATKQGQGYTTHSCTRCGNSFKDNITDFQPDPSQVYRDMIALKSKYPEGMHWTNDDSYYCRTLNIMGYGCAAFSFILSDAAFGYLPGRKHTNFGDVKVGDILRINNDSHSVVAIEVSSGGITLAEGNYNSSIHWGRHMSYSELLACGTYVLTRYPQNS